MVRRRSSTGAGTAAMERMEIVTSGGRRTYMADEKAALLVETAVPEVRVLAVAQRHELRQAPRGCQATSETPSLAPRIHPPVSHLR